jgi:hypothetical protein
MILRVVSGIFTVLAFWAAYLQLNDPDPERWFALYAAAGVSALRFATGKPSPRLALTLALIALGWALAIVPELWGRWQPSDLSVSMTSARPEIEFGREFGGLVIVATYCLSAFFVSQRSARAAQKS